MPAASAPLQALPEVAGCEAKLRMEGECPWGAGSSSLWLAAPLVSNLGSRHRPGRPGGTSADGMQLHRLTDGWPPPSLLLCPPCLPSAGDTPYVTDNSNYIVDLYFQTPIKDSHAGGWVGGWMQGPAGRML